MEHADPDLPGWKRLPGADRAGAAGVPGGATKRHQKQAGIFPRREPLGIKSAERAGVAT